jgi:hypothetical protein
MNTKLTPRERTVLAAWFARSNIGMGRAPGKDVQSLLTNKGGVPLDTAVLCLCRKFMETDEHFEMFLEEAQYWYKEFGPRKEYKTREAILKMWPDVKVYFWPTWKPCFD